MSKDTCERIQEIINRNLGPTGPLSLRRTAVLIGLNPGHLSRILSGKRKLCLDTAFAICFSLELNDQDTEDLLYIAAKSEAVESIRKLQLRLSTSNFISPAVGRNLDSRIGAITNHAVTIQTETIVKD